MAQRRRKQTYVRSVRCTPECSCHPAYSPIAADIHKWIEDGASNMQIMEMSEAAGHRVAITSLGRHRKHLDEIEVQRMPAPELSAGSTDLDILRLIIMRGAQRIPDWNIGPADTLRAMEMFFRFTQGSVMSDFMNLILSVDEEPGQAPTDGSRGLADEMAEVLGD